MLDIFTKLPCVKPLVNISSMVERLFISSHSDTDITVNGRTPITITRPLDFDHSAALVALPIFGFR